MSSLEGKRGRGSVLHLPGREGEEKRQALLWERRRSGFLVPRKKRNANLQEGKGGRECREASVMVDRSAEKGGGFFQKRKCAAGKRP